MNNITTQGYNIVKQVGFNLKFKADISYEEFCAHPEYQDIFEEMPDSIFTLEGFGTGRGIEQLKTYELIMQDFMTSTYVETFTNMLHPDVLGKNDYVSVVDMQQLQQGLPYNENRIEFDTLIAKYYLNNNRFYHQSICVGKDPISSEVLVLTPAMDHRIKMSSYDGIVNESEEYNSMVGFSQTKKTHMLGKYLLFISVLTDIDLYVVININEQRYDIMTFDQINQYVGYPFFLCCSLKRIIQTYLSHESQELLTSMRSSCGIRQNNYRRLIEDILDLCRQDGSVKITFELKNRIPSYLDFKIRDQDLDRRSELKEYKRGEQGVTRYTSIEEYGTKKTAVVSHGKIKYKG